MRKVWYDLMNALDNFIPLKEQPEYYEAYLYKVVFDHDKPKKYYIGYYEGLFDGTYKGTPVTHEKEFYVDLGKYEYKVYALDFGTAENMIYKEKLMLDDAKRNGNWKEFYNESTGGGAKLKNYNNAVTAIQDGVENGEFPIKYLLKEEIEHKITPWQVRFQPLITSHVTELKIQIKDSDGKWLEENHRGVLVLEDYHGKDEHLRISSRHTVRASQSVKQVTTLKVIFIPKKLWNKLEKEDITELGQWDNPQNDIPTLPTPPDETVTWMVGKCNTKGIKPNHESLKRSLLRQNYTVSQIKIRVAKAAKIISDNENINAGEIQIDYDKKGSEDYKKLMDKVQAFSGVAFSSAAGSPPVMVNNIVNAMFANPKETNFKIFVKVKVETGSTIINREWDDKGFKFVRERCDMFQRAEWFPTDKAKRDGKNGKEIKIEIEKLDFTKPNLL